MHLGQLTSFQSGELGQTFLMPVSGSGAAGLDGSHPPASGSWFPLPISIPSWQSSSWRLLVFATPRIPSGRLGPPLQISTGAGSALGKLTMTYRWKSWPTRAVAGTSGPSLAGVVATRGPKRRQGSSGVRVVSPERVNVVEAETVPVVEGQVCAIAKRDGDAPPGSQTASRTNSHHRDPRGPVGSSGVVAAGDVSRGTTEAKRRAETGSRIGP